MKVGKVDQRTVVVRDSSGISSGTATTVMGLRRIRHRGTDFLLFDPRCGGYIVTHTFACALAFISGE